MKFLRWIGVATAVLALCTPASAQVDNGRIAGIVRDSSGAFAAGLLVGWTAHGDRPKFRVVTGISAGALIAPFAYLGPEYDSVLRSVATSIDHDDLFRPRGLLAGLSNDGMADSAPLAQLVANYVTPAVLTAIAAEHKKGRALMIGTTDLDSGRAVTWNMGLQMLLLLFAAVVLGGIGTAFGPVAGALVIGVVTEVATYWINPEAKNAVAFVVLIAVLLVRPQGILGRAERVG